VPAKQALKSMLASSSYQVESEGKYIEIWCAYSFSLSDSASKCGLMVRGTTEGGLSARYCLSVSESILTVILKIGD
jgi:hypothetical protein